MHKREAIIGYTRQERIKVVERKKLNNVIIPTEYDNLKTMCITVS